MASPNQVCASIIEKVTSSRLDFSIHQTPYSLHFSLRKKFSKNSNKIPLDYSSSTNASLSESQDDRLRQELLNTRNEYDRLFNWYMGEQEAKSKLEVEYQRALENLASIVRSEESVKDLKKVNKSLNDRIESKDLELKHLKSEVEDIKKDKNSLSVALKAAKAEAKEQLKDFEKQKNRLENSILDLSEFKKVKLAEEREEKLKKRKELKKSKQKLKKETHETADGENHEPAVNQVLVPADQNYQNEAATFKPDVNFYIKSEKEDEHIAEFGGGKLDEANNFVEVNEDDEACIFNENDEGFIGPELPPRMTKEEIDVFYKEMMAKFKLDDNLMNEQRN